MTTVTTRRRGARATDHSTSGAPAGAGQLVANRRAPRTRSAQEPSRRGAPAARQPEQRHAHPDVRRRRDLGSFFGSHAARLRRIVASRLMADQQTIEDACQHAWAALADNAHVTLDQRGLAWLARVALREGWRLTATARRELPASCLAAAEDSGPVNGPSAHVGADEEALGRVEHRDRVRDLLALKGRERRDLFLHACGYRYTEIAALTGSSYTGVNRRLAEGKAELRRLERARGHT